MNEQEDWYEEVDGTFHGFDIAAMPEEEFAHVDIRIVGACEVVDNKHPERRVIKYEIRQYSDTASGYPLAHVGFFVTPEGSRLGMLLKQEIEKAQRGK